MHSKMGQAVQGRMAATLYLEDGTTYTGSHFGAAVSVPGEVGRYFKNLIRRYLFTKSLILYSLGQSTKAALQMQSH